MRLTIRTQQFFSFCALMPGDILSLGSMLKNILLWYNALLFFFDPRDLYRFMFQ